MTTLFYLVAKLYEGLLVRSSRLESGELRYGGNLLELSQEILGDSGMARLCIERLFESKLLKLMIDLNLTSETVEHPHPTSELVGEPQVFRVLEEEYKIGKEVDSVMKEDKFEKVLDVVRQLALAKEGGWIPSKEITQALPLDLPVGVRKQVLRRLVKKGVLLLKGIKGGARYHLVEVPPAKAPEVSPSDEDILVQLQEKIQKLGEDIEELQQMLQEFQQKRDELGNIRDDLRRLVEARQRAQELLAG